MSDGIDPGMAEQRAPGASRRRRHARRAAICSAALAVVAVAAIAAVGLGGRAGKPPVPGRTGPAATAAVTRQTLVEAVTVAGQLNYGPTIPLTSAVTGTVTWLPDVGAAIKRGEPLLRVDEQPVVLMFGTLPLYRPLAVDAKGEDVRQFEQNLAALGYQGFTVDDTFSATTVTAVKRWQKALRMTETGTVDKGRVSYAPGPIRVASQLVRVGASATGDVLSYTGVAKVVTVDADAGQAGWAAKGTKVAVNLPGGGSITGTVAAVSADLRAAAEGSRRDPGSPGTGGATVQITVELGDQSAAGAVASAPVDVRYPLRQRENVLTVPVGALLALAEGGYGVEVVTGGSARIVPVEVGLFADGRAEVQGDGLSEGMTVGVPQ